MNWKALVIGAIQAFARPQDAAVITSVIVPAAEGIWGLFKRPPEAPALTVEDVRAALVAAQEPWQRIQEAAKTELAEAKGGL